MFEIDDDAVLEWQVEVPTIRNEMDKTRQTDLFQLLLAAPDKDRSAIQRFFDGEEF
jgi:hypothetical protein